MGVTLAVLVAGCTAEVSDEAVATGPPSAEIRAEAVENADRPGGVEAYFESAVFVDPSSVTTLVEAVAVLEASACWSDRAVGYGGTKPAEYVAYELIRAEATTAQLTGWAEAGNPALTLYALQALAYREPGNDWAEIVERCLADDREVAAMSGCILWGSTVAKLAEEARDRGRGDRAYDDG